MSIEQYAYRVIEIIVVNHELPAFLKTLYNMGIASDKINHVEALMFSAFPFFIMGSYSYFRDESTEFKKGLLDATAKHIVPLSESLSEIDAKRLIAVRFKEYFKVTFEDGDASLSISELGLSHLARIAFKNITANQPLGLSTAVLIFSHFTTPISVYEGGAVLKKQYELYLEIGDEKWVAIMLKAFKSER